MSDRWLHAQREEVRARRRAEREECMRQTEVRAQAARRRNGGR